MKRTIIAVFCLVMAFVSGCGASEKNNGVGAIVEEFYESDYEYELTRKTMSENGDEIVVVYEGEIIASPYEEYIKVVAPQKATLWTECYYSKKGLSGKLLMKTDEGIVEQFFSKRDYPYGYGEDLEYVLDREETVNDVKCEVYKTRYTQDVGGGIQGKDHLEAVICQEYYIDREKQQLVMIYTDLKDLYWKNAIINSMIGDESLTLEAAQKRAEDKKREASETLKIFNYNGKIEMTVLEL